MFRNILVSFDGSPPAERALRAAVDIAATSNARLTILTSVPHPTAWATAVPSTAGMIAEAAAQFEHEAQATQRRAADLVPDDIPVTTILTHEPIRPALVREIAGGRHDLLVMGSRGRGALAASMLGSVSHFALNHVPIALLVVHEGQEAEVDSPAADPAGVAVAAAA